MSARPAIPGSREQGGLRPFSLRGLSSGGIAVRLFVTAWIIYGLHFATDIVREYYPALALGDHFSFRLDEYAGLHPDLFEKEGYGWHQGNNPGLSFAAAVPYALARPLIDPVVEKVVEGRRAAGLIEDPPVYDTPWPRDRYFFEETWRRGLDIKLGLASWVMQFFFMAPLCAVSVVAVFYVLRLLLASNRMALWFSILYAFGTPVFYRSAFLNQNIALGIVVFLAFLVMWDPWERWRLAPRGRFLVGGLGGGLAVLFDYSGVVFLAGLFLYGLALVSPQARRPGEADGRSRPSSTLPSLANVVRGGLWYSLGAIGPLCLLWFYQWRSYGHPFLPGQHWMPPVEWIDLGYQGYGLPQAELILALAFDHRFGLFVFCPLLLLALFAPLVDRGKARILPRRETWLILLLFLGLTVFFSGSNYTRLQYNTGVRYLTAIIPFLFLPTAAVLVRLPRWLIYFGGVFQVGWMWALAMHREVQAPLGVLDPVLRTLVGGFALPALRTFEWMGDAYGGFAAGGASPLPLFLLAATFLLGVWAMRTRFDRGEGG